MSYDQKCYDLAWEFLSDIQEPVKPADADRLAQEIQQTIEDYLEEVESREKPTEEPPAPDAYRDYQVKFGKWLDAFQDSMLSPKKP